MREIEVYADYPMRGVQFFLRDYRDKIVFEAVCRRHGARIVRFFSLGNFRVWPLVLKRDDLVSDFIKRALKSMPQNGAASVPDEHFRETYPALFDFMTVTRIDLDGREAARLTATVNVFVQDGFFKAFLNDRQTGRSLCVAAVTFTRLWEALEEALTSDEVPWRQRNEDGSTTRQKGRRREP